MALQMIGMHTDLWTNVRENMRTQFKVLARSVGNVLFTGQPLLLTTVMSMSR